MALKRILFVDDERAVLDGLRQRLYRAQRKWNMHFVESAELAIDQFEREPFDVLVTDVRMPGTDGAQLLEIIAQRWPESARIVLSGYAEPKQVMRLVPLAHQYLTKPCEPERLEHAIEQCTRLQELLRSPRLQLAVGKMRRLPAIPAVYQRLNEAMSQEGTTITEIAGIIARDSGVAAKVLQVVNSAFFRLSRPVTSVEQAVSYLGMSSVRNLVIAAEVFCQGPCASAPAGMELGKLQHHAQAVAAGARALGVRCSWSDDAILAGLLHDIGFWVMLQQCPEELAQVLELAREKRIEIHSAERELLGTTHAEIGAYLLGLWGLPYSILDAVAFHHDPAIGGHEFGLVAAVAIANAVVESGSSGAEPTLGALSCRDYLASLDSPMDWSEAQERIAAAINEDD